MVEAAAPAHGVGAENRAGWRPHRAVGPNPNFGTSARFALTVGCVMRVECFFISVVAMSVASATSVICRAGPVEDAIAAAMALSDQPNYSWTVTVADDAQSYLIEGKSRQDGWNWTRQPMVRAVANRIGREAEPDLEAIFKGDSDGVVRTARGWQRLRELSWLEPVIDDDPPPLEETFPGVRSSGILGLNYPVPPPSAQARKFAPDGPALYSNAQFGVSPPHQELAIIVSSFTALEVNGDVASGTLDETGAKLLLVRDGQRHLTPLAAGGQFKLTVRHGQVVSYMLALEGVLQVDEHDRRGRVLVHQSSNTVLKDVGTTNFEVPAEARRKLGP